MARLGCGRSAGLADEAPVNPLKSLSRSSFEFADEALCNPLKSLARSKTKQAPPLSKGGGVEPLRPFQGLGDFWRL